MGQPDRLGYFGSFGGRFVPETLMAPLLDLEREYTAAKRDKSFRSELHDLLRTYAGRPTPLYFARRLTEKWKGAQVYLKREDLTHTGAHKINNCLGQALLAVRMGKRRLIAETGAGQHGVAVATVACRFGLACTVYMGRKDMERQAPNVNRMKLLGAEVIGVESGSMTLKDATNEAIRDWVATVAFSHYVIGSTVGPHPYPLMVRNFQSVIGYEAKRQIYRLKKRLPHAVIACVGGGSNSLGIFHAFAADAGVQLIGVETSGFGLHTRHHAATLARGTPGVLHGSYSYLLQDKFGQIRATHSVAAGLDYPGVGPEHSNLKTTGRARYVTVTDKKALEAFVELSRTEGIIPALESSFALAYARKLAPRMGRDKNIIVCLSGRGDKDLANVQDYINSRNGSGRCA